jgi:hypothetical protein
MEAIAAFVGTNGGGKSLAAVEQYVIPSVAEGRVIVSNMRLEVPDFRLLRSWKELIRVGVHTEFGVPCRIGARGQRLTIRDAAWNEDLPLYSVTLNRPVLVVLDEITAVLPSRSYSSMPTQLQRVLNQLRKQETTLVWTAPNWARCDVLLREVTKEVTVCRGYLRDRYQRIEERALFPKPLLDDDGCKVRTTGSWAPRRLFRWTTYDAVDFEDFTADDQQRIKPLGTRWYWRPAYPAQFLYNTTEAVQLLDHLDDTGTCIVCSGRRTQQKCSCCFEDDTANTGAGSREAAGRGSRPSARTLIRSSAS